ncbi:MAG: hypothetical protein KA953_09100 [Lachnospiraceae bacterium]|nr:hypothetical protein [Lachnospiraceae bacterium]
MTVLHNCLINVKATNSYNIGYPPAGTTAMTMISLYLKKATQAQIPHTNPAGG